MKKLFYVSFTVFWVCILFFACTNGTVREELVWAEELMESRPDSALTLLDSIPSPEKMSKAHYAAYGLLLTEARDKNYYPLKSDSLIRAAMVYYEGVKDKRKLPKAYYYMGRVYQERQEIPYALEYYRKAEIHVDDARLASRIYNSMGSIYTQLHLYADAMVAYKKAEHYLYVCKDSVGVPFVRRNIARIYHVTEQPDSAVFYYRQAIALSKKVHNQHALLSSLTEIAGLYIDIDEYSDATACLFEISTLLPDKSASDQLKLIYGRFYQHTGKSDSALYYLNQSLKSETIYTKAASYYRLYQIAKAGQNYKQAFTYVDAYHLYKDSIVQQAEREESLQIQNLYNFQKITAEKEQLEQRHNKKQHLIIYLVIISLSAILFVFILFLYQRQRMKNEALIKERRLRLQKELYEKSQERIKENMLQIASLTDKLKENETRLDQTEKVLVEKQMELLKYVNLYIELTNENKRLQSEKLVSSPIYTHLKNARPKELLNEERWNAFKQMTDQIHGCLETKLREYYPKISEIELTVCYLTYANFSVTEIANLIGRTKSAITKCRKRLYEKIHGSAGSSEDLDQFIANL
jgi:tetratricopeptide (TPR) repeat protein